MRILFTVAALVVIVAGMRAARELVVPLLFAVFVSILCLPILGWLRRRGVPNLPAVILIAGAFLVIGSVLGTFAGVSVTAFVKALPEYQSRMDSETAAVFEWLEARNVRISAQGLLDYLSPNKAMSLTETAVSGFNMLLGNGMVILFTLVFLLIEATSFPSKLRAAVADPDKVMDGFQKFGIAAQRYMISKAITSAATGLGVWACLVIIGVDYPVLWGLLAFLLNFVPYIGALLSTVPPVLLALVQLGVWPAVWTAVGLTSVNTVIGIIEPRLLSRGVGLSAFVVFLSLIFWGWILGPIGAVLSVPLTIIVKIGLESTADSRWAATMLGPAGPGDALEHPAPARDDATK